MSQRIEVERLLISLDGVSSLVAEEALVGLEHELQRRLGALPAGRLRALDAAELAIVADLGDGRLDPDSLRRLIADRLVEALAERPPAELPATEEEG